MGLPLYHAPVESDIKPKAPRDSTARARSTIRRPTRPDFEASLNRYHADRNRVPSDRTVRLQSANGLTHTARLHASLALDENAGSADSTPTLRWIGPRAAILSHTPSRLQVAPRQYDVNPPALRRTPVLQEVVDVSDISQEMARFFGEQLTVLRPEQSRSSQTPEPAHEHQDHGARPTPRPIMRHRASAPRPSFGDRENQRILDANRARPPRQSYGRRLIDQLRAGRLARQAAQESQSAEREAPRVPNGTAPRLAPLSPLPVIADAQPQHSPVDGLGDRDRSLSPEGDGVWDTLLSSITPDPQPPSVGTSFQSTSTPTSASASAPASALGSGSASASTSQSTAPSTTFPWYNEDEPERERDLSGTLTDADFDRFCFGSDDEGSDVEGGGDGEDTGPWPGLLNSPANTTAASHTATRLWPPDGRRRSYADVVAHSRSTPQQAGQQGGQQGEQQEQQERQQEEEQGRQESQQQQQHESQSQIPDDDDSQVDASSMQRIIRILMERPDLSDEWWAAVGLSRSLPREAA